MEEQEDNNDDDNEEAEEIEAEDDQLPQSDVEFPEEEEEDDEYYQPKEADETRANKLLFSQLVERLEKLWLLRKHATNSSFSVLPRKKTKLSQEDKLSKYLFPKQLKTYFGSFSSLFPMLRLILPDLDNIRGHLGMKESVIAKAWTQALGLTRRHHDAYNRIVHFTDPTVHTELSTVGDLSLCIESVLAERLPTHVTSKVTIGQINNLLDELAAIKRYSGTTTTTHRTNLNGDSIVTKLEQDSKGNSIDIVSSSVCFPQLAPPSNQHPKAPTKQDLRKEWVKKLVDLQLSPLEHKWIVRIILQKMDFGISWNPILRFIYKEDMALELHNSNKNLKKLCACLADSEYMERHMAKKQALEEKLLLFRNNMLRMPCYLEEVQVGSTIRPMLSKRTNCSHVLIDMERMKDEFVFCREDDETKLKRLLPIQFPTFICEIKLDGERMIVHVRRGIVTMHTRQGNWYSRLYSPIIAPDIRNAIRKFDVDVILDGEMIAWDNSAKENMLFGVNKTVAKMRRKWCSRQVGMIDERDICLHSNDESVANITTVAAEEQEDNNDYDKHYNPYAGANCWMKFVAFDILYVGGPDAQRLMELSNPYRQFLSQQQQEQHEGSIIHLDGFYRKSVLYNLITQQENKVEIVESVVISSDGSDMPGQKYFTTRQDRNNTLTEVDQHSVSLDSVVTLSMQDNDVVNKLIEVDEKRRARRTDEKINLERAQALDRFYTKIVDLQGQEGVMIKILSAPYVLGEGSRSKGYWRKLKPDYDGSDGSQHPIKDLDCLVLGGYYASGLREAGRVNTFLLGCVEPSDLNVGHETKYITVGKVGKGITNQEYDRLLEMTGFGRDDGSNKWFKCSGSELPDFVSDLSFQRSFKGDMDGWKFTKDKLPDLWINPSDSFVLSILAADIIASDTYAAGLTFRFPRIYDIRVDGLGKGRGGKLPEEVESLDLLHQLFKERQKQLSGSKDINSSDALRSSGGTNDENCRFLSSTKVKRRAVRNTIRPTIAAASKIPLNVPVISDALKGRSFFVLEGLEGSYKLNPASIDALEAKNEGWIKEASEVTNREDVVTFILLHGGTCTLTANTSTDFILGGNIGDPRVKNYKDALQSGSNTGNTKKSMAGKRQKILDTIDGVLKWIYIYRAVMLWREQMKKVKKDPEKCATDPALRSILVGPRSCDYLIMSKATEAKFAVTEDKFGDPLLADSTMIGLLRTLTKVQESKEKCQAKEISSCETIIFPAGTSLLLQSPANCERLEQEDKWVLSGKRQYFSPFLLNYQNGKVSGGYHSRPITVLYPDVFGDDFGLADSEQVSAAEGMQRAALTDELRLAALIPVVESMGAFVTTHLHEKVTHILCELKYHDSIEWIESLPIELFVHQNLHLKLIKMTNNCSQKFQLISPIWVRKKWAEASFK